MSIFKCKMCGGTIEFDEGATVGVCDSCGTKQTLPRIDDDKKANLYDRANHFRRNNEFDKAAAIYEQILNEDTTDAEAYWSLVLCQYGIEYVEDPATHKRVPTVNRAQFTSIFDDDNYKSAIEYADSMQKELYEKEAKVINDIQKGILAISQKEEPFDVFICYKETDNNGRRTPDSVLANELYHQLVEEGFKVFFARITLEDKLGTAYEPYIFAALQSSKVMVVLGTRPEYFNAVWVKNEWSRYLTLVKKSGGKKILIPAYRDMDPYDLPEEFSHLQAQDMSKLGFMQDLIRGIRKIVKVDVVKNVQKDIVVSSSNNKSIEPLLERAFLFLEDGKWQDADIYCEKVLDIDPRNARAYLGKLMADLKVNNEKGLADLPEPFDGEENYAKVLRFADEKLEAEIRGYIEHINERNENERLNDIYDDAIRRMGIAHTEEDYKLVAESFKSISGFKDADDLADKCIEQAKDSIYSSAKMIIESDYSVIKDYELAIEKLNKVYEWKDSKELINVAQKKIEELEIKKVEKGKKIKKLAIASLMIGVIIIATYIIITKVVLPSQKYNKAMNLMNSGDYKEAYEILKELDYKDSADKLVEAKYNKAINLMDSGNYKEAYEILKGLDYKDSDNKLVEAKYKYYKVLLAQSQVGDYVYFGSYEQDNDTTNGKEDIEWLVLAKENNKALLISKYALDCKPYNISYTDVTWETCSLRKWLNEEFINDAFSPAAQQSILSSTVNADKNSYYSTNPGNNTNDKVFLLSISEAYEYFSPSNARICRPTKFAISKGVWESRNSGACRWWLRSPGSLQRNAAYVNYGGDLTTLGDLVNRGRGVLPALWVEINN